MIDALQNNSFNALKIPHKKPSVWLMRCMTILHWKYLVIKEEQRMAINDTLEDPVVLICNNIFKRLTTCLKYLQVDKQF